jgi:DNA-binding transcriptional ArsR family regulator
VRDKTPIRVAFLHPPVTRGGRGPLAAFVEQRRSVALDLLLFAHAVWPLSEPKPINASGADWARAIGIDGKPGSRAMISRSWSWLEDQELIRTTRQGRVRAVEIRRDDGSGQPWTNAYEADEAYFGLSNDYWASGFAQELGLRAKATLLIAVSLLSDGRSFFELPVERGAAWYGLSPSTVGAGLRELREAGLLRTSMDRRDSRRSPVGFTYDRQHALVPFHHVAAMRRKHSQGVDEKDDPEFAAL